jgi:hypothetical protein
METVLLVGLIASAVISGSVAALRTIAPLTDWKGDDKALGFLQTVESILAKIFVPAKYLKSGDEK